MDITLLTLCDEYCHLSVRETEAEQYEVLQRERDHDNKCPLSLLHCHLRVETETWKQENHLASIT